MRARRGGFTILETILVMVVLVVLASLAIPSMQAVYGPTNIEAAADEVRSVFSNARNRAIEEGRPYRCEMNTADPTKIRYVPDIGTEEESSTALEPERELPKGIQLVLDGEQRLAGGSDAPQSQSDTTSEAGWTKLVVFLPDGSCSSDIELTVQDGVNQSIILTLRGMTGAVTQRSAPPEARP